MLFIKDFSFLLNLLPRDFIIIYSLIYLLLSNNFKFIFSLASLYIFNYHKYNIISEHQPSRVRKFSRFSKIIFVSRTKRGRVHSTRCFECQLFDLIRCKEIDDVKSGAVERVKILGAEAAEREARANGVERELRLEREWRTSLQEASISNAEKISQLHQEIDQLRRVSEVCCMYQLRQISTFKFDGQKNVDLIANIFSVCRILILLEL